MKLNLRSEVRSAISQFAVRHIAESIIQLRKRACSEGNQTIGRMGRFPPLGVQWLPRRFVARNINSTDTRLAHKIARTAFIPVDRFLLALMFLRRAKKKTCYVRCSYEHHPMELPTDRRRLQAGMPEFDQCDIRESGSLRNYQKVSSRCY